VNKYVNILGGIISSTYLYGVKKNIN